MLWDYQIFETPVADPTGNVLHRWIKHSPCAAGCNVLAAVALPFLAVEALTAKNVFSLDAYSNHLFWSLLLLLSPAKYVPEKASVPLSLISA